jgi:hypothetical protein
MATYSYGKKTRVRRAGVKAIGPTSAELEARAAKAPVARMASYTPPSADQGISPGEQLKKATMRQRMAQQAQQYEARRRRYQEQAGKDGGVGTVDTPARQLRQYHGPEDSYDWRTGGGASSSGLYSPSSRSNAQSRRRKGNRYYRTD